MRKNTSRIIAIVTTLTLIVGNVAILNLTGYSTKAYGEAISETSSTELTTTEQGTTEEITTRYVDANGFTKIPGTSGGEVNNLGAWTYRVYDWSNGTNVNNACISYKGGNEANDFWFRIDKNTADNKPHIIQTNISFPIEKGEQYKYTIKFNVQTTEPNPMTLRTRLLGFTQQEDKLIHKGENEFTGVFKAVGASKDCNIELEYGFIKAPGTVIHFTEVSVEKQEMADYLPLIKSSKNIAKNKTITINNGNGNDYEKGNIIDGNINTNAALSTQNAWNNVVVDLGEPCNISDIENILLRWYDYQSFCKNYNMEVSLDGAIYYNICSVVEDKWNLIVGRGDKNNILNLPLNFSKVPITAIRYVKLKAQVESSAKVVELAVIKAGELITEPETTQASTTQMSTTQVPTTPVYTTHKETQNLTKHETTAINSNKTTTTKQVSSSAVKIGKAAIRKVTRNGKKAKISLKKIKGAKGYLVQYSSKKSFAKKYTRTIRTRKLKITISKLKSKKKYYCRVKAYIVIDGKNKYGKWSGKKSIK